MKNNDLHKNQPHAQALTDNSLENVSGGWQELTASTSFMGVIPYYPRYKLDKKERKKLESLGYTILESYDGGYSVNKDGRDITYDEMRNIFGNEKF